SRLPMFLVRLESRLGSVSRLMIWRIEPESLVLPSSPLSTAGIAAPSPRETPVSDSPSSEAARAVTSGGMRLRTVSRVVAIGIPLSSRSVRRGAAPSGGVGNVRTPHVIPISRSSARVRLDVERLLLRRRSGKPTRVARFLRPCGPANGAAGGRTASYVDGRQRGPARGMARLVVQRGARRNAADGGADRRRRRGGMERGCTAARSALPSAAARHPGDVLL